jgi:hypothetical protein
MWGLVLKLAVVDLNWATQHISYWLVRCQRDMNPIIDIRHVFTIIKFLTLSYWMLVGFIANAID